MVLNPSRLTIAAGQAQVPPPGAQQAPKAERAAVAGSAAAPQRKSEKTPEERVGIVSRSGGDHLDVMLDGKTELSFEMHERKDAERYATGLIAELKAGQK